MHIPVSAPAACPTALPWYIADGGLKQHALGHMTCLSLQPSQRPGGSAHTGPFPRRTGAAGPGRAASQRCAPRRPPAPLQSPPGPSGSAQPDRAALPSAGECRREARRRTRWHACVGRPTHCRPPPLSIGVGTIRLALASHTETLAGAPADSSQRQGQAGASDGEARPGGRLRRTRAPRLRRRPARRGCRRAPQRARPCARPAASARGAASWPARPRRRRAPPARGCRPRPHRRAPARPPAAPPGSLQTRPPPPAARRALTCSAA